jgi:hypothetical protein
LLHELKLFAAMGKIFHYSLKKDDEATALSSGTSYVTLR